MNRGIAGLALACLLVFAGCAKKEPEAPQSSSETPAAAPTATAGPHAIVHLKDGSKVPGTIVASTQTDMTVDGDNGIESKIPLSQVKSVEYSDARQARSSPSPQPVSQQPAQTPASTPQPAQQPAAQPAQQPAAAPAQQSPPVSQPAVTPQTYELPAGSEISVRTNDLIDSATAAEGQTFSAQVTRDVKDASDNTVIPKGSPASIIIRSASKGGHFRGASDLVLDLQSVTINGQPYNISVADISQKGKSGVGANKRTIEYTGAGAALGAIIGAIAGGGKGAAIGAGAGGGAGVITQILTKGDAIKVPVESVLTFKLDKPLKVIS